MAVETRKEAKTQIYTTVYTQLMEAWGEGKRRFFTDGGTSASKTFSIMQFLIGVLEKYPEPILATVSSESMPHLKRGCIRDFVNIMGDEMVQSCWNKTDFIYTFHKSGCKLEFVSDDRPEKFTGGRRDIHFWNELNNIHKLSYMEGDLRTRLFTIADWNPYSEFWFHDDKIAEVEGNVYLGGLTYKDVPEVVSSNVIKTIEGYKDTDPNYYRVHALGLLGKLEGLVYPKFEQVDELPKGNYFYGLDYGFSSDPTVLVKNVIIEDKLYSQEMFYNYNQLTNEDIAREMSLCGVKRGEVIQADRDEPKSAEELSRLGFSVQAIDKAYANPAFGIKKVNSYKQYWTKDSLNCIKEQRNYRFLEDKEHQGRFTDKTTHRWSHGMSARRFALAPHIERVGGTNKLVVVGW